MARAVVPRLGDRALWLLSGRADGPATSTHRAPQLDEEDYELGGDESSLYEGAQDDNEE